LHVVLFVDVLRTDLTHHSCVQLALSLQCCREGFLQGVRLLLAQPGINPNIANASGTYPLHALFSSAQNKVLSSALMHRRT
jgi:hypothetical protein